MHKIYISANIAYISTSGERGFIHDFFYIVYILRGGGLSKHPISHIITGTSFQVFPGGGQNFDRLPRGGQNMKKKILCAKFKKITIFQIHCPPVILLIVVCNETYF